METENQPQSLYAMVRENLKSADLSRYYGRERIYRCSASLRGIKGKRNLVRTTLPPRLLRARLNSLEVTSPLGKKENDV